MQNIQILKDEDVSRIINSKKGSYLAMYSSHFGGIIKDPKWMMIPVDDHVVHRGDGVFEAIRFLDSKIYGLDEHLARLKRSANAIEMIPKQSTDEIREIILQTVRASGSPDGMIRLYLTRGPGGFTTDPYEPVQNGLYVIITKFKAMSDEKYSRGVSCKISKYLAKEDFYTQIKSCNYLQNVLMKKDAIDSKVDFTVALDSRGFITEGSTENCAFVSAQNELLFPSFENTLRGITITRVIELAQSLIKSGELNAVKETKISEAEAFKANEMAFIGTTLDVISVATLNGKNIGTGKPGPIFQKLQQLMLEDVKNPSSKMNTKI